MTSGSISPSIADIPARVPLSPKEALITLNLIPGLGSIRIQSLLAHFGSAELVLSAPPSLLERVPRIGPAMAAAIADWRNCTNAAEEIAAAEAVGVRLITFTEDAYPTALRRMSDPPIVLSVRGNLQPSDSERGVAIVGTRLATPYGRVQARRFGRELADAGCTIISGLALGIDEEAHIGALEAGGRTIAVLGFGIGQLHLARNAALAEDICRAGGAVVSEFPLYMRASRTTFPQRNRIVAAWAQATLVAEAPARSGAMHTAGLAAEYGRSVFALPGDIQRESSAGCHALIRDGATLCTSPQELLADLGQRDELKQGELFSDVFQAQDSPDPTAPTPSAPALPSPNTQEHELLQAVAAGHDTLDALCSALGRGASELTPLLLKLQILHHLVPLEGGRFACR